MPLSKPFTMQAPPTDFRIFPLLPTEIRLLIWRLSCPPSRLVEVRYDPDSGRCSSPTKPPVIVQVNREARSEALLLYQRAFQSQGQSEYIFFCPALDTLYFPRHRPMGYDDTARDFARAVPDAPRLVRHVAIDYVEPDELRPWEPYNKAVFLQNLPLLGRAFLVMHKEADAQVSQGPLTENGERLLDPQGYLEHVAVAESVDRVMEDLRREFVAASIADVGSPRPQDDLWCLPVLEPKVKREATKRSCADLSDCANQCEPLVRLH